MKIRNNVGADVLKSAQKGITLIALVITIIVMLILVAVTISMAVNGGLFEYAQSAGIQTNGAVANEQLLASGQVNIDNVIYNSIDEYINSGSTTPTIDWDTIVEELPTKYDEYLALAQAKGQVITGTDAELNIGIGTDGQVVNLSLWHYYKTDDGAGMSLGKKSGCEAYRGYDDEDLDAAGKVQGKMPQYIYIKSENEVYPVTLLQWTFTYSYAVTGILEIPSTVTTIDELAFNGCSGLTDLTVPNSVTSIGDNAFWQVPHITYYGAATGERWGALSMN